MRRLQKLLVVVVGAIASFASLAQGTTISGAVKGPDGAPFKGAFVQVQNLKTRITVHVLSDKEGHYRVDNLEAGDYTLRIRAVGYRTDPRSGVALTGNQNDTFDWNLQKAPVRWNELSFYQGDALLPEGKGKQLLERNCFECHAFQNKMASVPRDEEGWTRAVNFMRTAMHYRLPNFSDDDASTVVAYLNNVFGQDATVPRTVDQMPEYKSLVRPPFADEAMNIVYVTYELPGPDRMPFSAAPDKDGNMWIPYFGTADKIGELNPKTGDVQEYPVPFQGTAGIHSAVPAPDGTVWLAEQGSNRLGKWDPKTRQITEYQDSLTPGELAPGRTGSKHTVRIDPEGNVWLTGTPFTKFDPKTEKFTHYSDVPWAYGVAMSKTGIPWFAEFSVDGKIGMVDPETGKVSKFAVPTAKAYPRRIQVDDSGVVWFTEFGSSPSQTIKEGKLARYDPKTETFKEYTLPGNSPSPYAFDLDNSGRLWYSNMHEDVVGSVDPKTGRVVEYPIPLSENTFREFFVDSQGRMWFGSQPNNKVGYFYLASK